MTDSPEELHLLPPAREENEHPHRLGNTLSRSSKPENLDSGRGCVVLFWGFFLLFFFSSPSLFFGYRKLTRRLGEKVSDSVRPPPLACLGGHKRSRGLPATRCRAHLPPAPTWGLAMPRRGRPLWQAPPPPHPSPVPPGPPPQIKAKALRAGPRPARAGPPAGPRCGGHPAAARASDAACPRLETVLVFFSFSQARYGARTGPPAGRGRGGGHRPPPRPAAHRQRPGPAPAACTPGLRAAVARPSPHLPAAGLGSAGLPAGGRRAGGRRGCRPAGRAAKSARPPRPPPPLFVTPTVPLPSPRRRHVTGRACAAGPPARGTSAG